MRYGLPYNGSKNKLAERIVNLLPRATHLFDIFAGGGSVTHCALLSGKWECVHFSDISNSVELLRDCFEGNIPDGSEWISREEFFKRKDSDPYVRLLYSFGNNQRQYLYGKDVEPYKKAVHEMIFAPTPNERRLKFREVCKLIPSVLGLNGVGGYDECQTTSRWKDYRGCIQASTPRASITPPPNQLSIRVLQDLQHNESIQRLQTISKSTDFKARSGGGLANNSPYSVGSMRCA